MAHAHGGHPPTQPLRRRGRSVTPGPRRRDPGAGTRRRVRAEQGGRYARGRGAAVEGHRARARYSAPKCQGAKGFAARVRRGSCRSWTKRGTRPSSARPSSPGAGSPDPASAASCPRGFVCGMCSPAARQGSTGLRGSGTGVRCTGGGFEGAAGGEPPALPSSGMEPERERGRGGSRVPARCGAAPGPPLPAGAGGCLAAARRQRRLLSPP